MFDMYAIDKKLYTHWSSSNLCLCVATQTKNAKRKIIKYEVKKQKRNWAAVLLGHSHH